MSTQLESPALCYRDSYLSLLEEFRAGKEPLIPFPLKFPTDDFPAFLERLAGCAKGSEIAKGFVVHETFWLVQDGTVVGVSNLRHTLTDALRKDGGHIGYGIRPSARRQGHAKTILAKTLEKAKQRGLTRALLTAHKGNIGSIRTIIAQGGKLESEELLPGHPDVLQRYWIDIV